MGGRLLSATLSCLDDPMLHTSRTLQTSRTVVIKADPDQLWVLLNDMIAHPERYEPDVVLTKLERHETPVRRTVSRDGQRVEETLEIHRDALMIELTVPSGDPGGSAEPHLSLIHQVVPSGDRTILNLAATWAPVGDEPLEDTSRAVDTVTVEAMERRLANLGNRIQLMAEVLASKKS